MDPFECVLTLIVLTAFGVLAMATRFKKLPSDNPFVDYIKALLEDNFLKQHLFHFEYEAREELASISCSNWAIEPQTKFDDLERSRQKGRILSSDWQRTTFCTCASHIKEISETQMLLANDACRIDCMPSIVDAYFIWRKLKEISMQLLNWLRLKKEEVILTSFLSLLVGIIAYCC